MDLTKYYITPCGDGMCVNGPPNIETYVLCDVCAKKCPDAFDFGIARMPEKWKKLTSKRDKEAARKDRKSSNISAYTIHMMMKNKEKKQA